MMIRTPIIYPGSKSNVLEDIIPLIPEFEEYREPFMGSCSIFFGAKNRYSSKRFWINDLSYELYNFFLQLRDNTDLVIEKALELRKGFKTGKEMFYHLRRNMNTFSVDEQAGAYFIINRCAFSGGTLVAGFSEDHYKLLNDDKIKDLGLYKEVLNNVNITNLDYEKVILAPSNGIDDKDIFIMLDPPYLSATDSGLYGKSGRGRDLRNTHKAFDHNRFAKVMKNVNDNTEMKFLITYDDSKIIRELFSWANISPWKLTYNMRKKGDKIGKEIFISNFDTERIVTGQLTMDNAWG